MQNIIRTINTNINKYYKAIVALFFVVLLITGIFAFGDYGISTDEPAQLQKGAMTYGYILTGRWTMPTIVDKYHGLIYTTTLFFIERILGYSQNLRTVYLARHLINFLLFYSAVFSFYLIIKKVFKSWKLGLLGSFFLILSPRIFANSFYNPKDLPFLSIFIISIYTLINFLENKTVAKAVTHAVLCSVLTGVRIVGIIVPLMTLILFFTDIFIKERQTFQNSIKLKKIKILFIYLFVYILLTVILWPMLWENPFYHFVEAFKQMSKYPWFGKTLYMGNIYTGNETP